MTSNDLEQYPNLEPLSNGKGPFIGHFLVEENGHKLQADLLFGHEVDSDEDLIFIFVDPEEKFLKDGMKLFSAINLNLVKRIRSVMTLKEIRRLGFEELS